MVAKAVTIEHEHDSMLGFGNDIGLWPELASTDMITFWAEKGPTSLLQNCDQDILRKYSISQKQEKPDGSTFFRKCTQNLFLRKTTNSETCQRNWLCFSKHTGKVYCFICKLTGSKSITTNFSSSGFCYWKHASVRVSKHESSKGHLEAIITLAQRGKKSGGIYHELAKHESEICVYWNQILQRVISTIKFIAERRLAFRGDNEIVGSPHNGNYLGILELLSEYDTFLAAHTKMHANKGRDYTSYLSSTICEEIINLMGSQVLKCIFCSIKKSEYFSVSVDSTPNEAHIDQLTIITRYMDMEKLIPNERFLTFILNTGHTGREMTEALLKYLESNGISLHDCRGQVN